MHKIGDQLWLSPSDLTAFLSCAHLTTLAKGDVGRGVSHQRSADADLLAAKGLEHERPVLDVWRAGGPPGSGKTFFAVRVIAECLRQGPICEE